MYDMMLRCPDLSVVASRSQTLLRMYTDKAPGMFRIQFDIFKPDQGAAVKETVVYAFDGTEGANQGNALIQGSDNNFYGSSFRLTPQGTLTVLHIPDGALIQGVDGNFYETVFHSLLRLANEAQAALDSLDAGGDLRNAVMRCYYEMNRILVTKKGLLRSRWMTAREFETLVVAQGLPAAPTAQPSSGAEKCTR